MSRLIIRNSAPGSALKIVILTAPERPEEPEQTDEPEPERQGYKDDEHFHQSLRCVARRAPRALSITSSEEPDMAAAAMRGVTNPATAIGTARRL
jgi:hypothetical protein